MSKWKREGEDEIKNELLKELNDIICEYLVILFNKWIDNGIIEEEGINGLVILLYKKGKINDPMN